MLKLVIVLAFVAGTFLENHSASVTSQWIHKGVTMAKTLLNFFRIINEDMNPAVQFPKKSSLTNAPITAPVNEKTASVKTKPSMARQNSLTSSSYSHKLYSPFGIKPFERKLSATIGPTRLDSFEFISLLGEGSYAQVYLVRINGQLYATKAVNINKARAHDRKYIISKDQYTLHDLFRELDISVAVSTSPWLTTIRLAFPQDCWLFYVFDLEVGGAAVDQPTEFFTGGQPINWRTFFRNTRIILSQLMVAVDELHQMGFVHEDLKWDNILVDKDGFIKLGDLGYAMMLSSDGKDYEDQALMSEQSDFREIGYMIDELIKVFIREIQQLTPLEAEEWQQEKNKLVSLRHFMEDISTPQYRGIPNRFLLDYVWDHPFFEGVDWNAVVNRTSDPIKFRPVDLNIKSLDARPEFKCDAPLSVADQETVISNFYYVDPDYKH